MTTHRGRIRIDLRRGVCHSSGRWRRL